MPRITGLNELERQGKIVKGDWAFDPLHRLTYQTEEDEEEFKFESSLIAAEPEALVFSISEKQTQGKITASIAKLKGRWLVNDQNQIQFEVEKESGRNDVLTFSGNWKLNERHEIVYSFSSAGGKRKNNKIQKLIFKGWWEITEKNRLTYLIEGDSHSSFRFRGTFQTASILAKRGEVRYQLGIEGKKQKKAKTIILFGKWKLSDKLDLVFEIEYGKNEKREIRFGADYMIRKDLAVSAELINRDGEPLGVQLILTKRFLRLNADAFLKLKRTLRVSSLEAGIRIPW